jgi:hypothetical protein
MCLKRYDWIEHDKKNKDYTLRMFEFNFQFFEFITKWFLLFLISAQPSSKFTRLFKYLISDCQLVSPWNAKIAVLCHKTICITISLKGKAPSLQRMIPKNRFTVQYMLLYVFSNFWKDERLSSCCLVAIVPPHHSLVSDSCKALYWYPPARSRGVYWVEVVKYLTLIQQRSGVMYCTYNHWAPLSFDFDHWTIVWHLKGTVVQDFLASVFFMDLLYSIRAPDFEVKWMY